MTAFGSRDDDERRQWAEQVFAAVRRLSPVQAMVVEYVYLDGHTQREASAAFGIAPPDIAHFVAQALRTLSVTATAPVAITASPAALGVETASTA